MSAVPRSTPIRGTQSFVGIMGQVWSRPSLSGMEIAWRWLPAGLLLSVPLLMERTVGINILVPIGLQQSLRALQSVSVFEPVLAVDTVRAAATALRPPFTSVLVVLLLWNAIAALGRTFVLRRYDPTLSPRRITLFSLGVLRSAVLLAAWWLWFLLIAFSAGVTITGPAAHNQEPSVVLFAAMMICGTLLLYVLWAVFSWFLHLAPLLAMRRNLGAVAALRASLTSGPVRGKLIEINLVMSIVKIALIVLAMVFSATPLPFTAVATPEFLRLWWVGVVLLYFAACDYFHVVRAASYLALYRAYQA